MPRPLLKVRDVSPYTENVSDAFYGCTALASVRVTGGTKNVYTSVNGMLLSDNGSTPG